MTNAFFYDITLDPTAVANELAQSFAPIPQELKKEIPAPKITIHK